MITEFKQNCNNCKKLTELTQENNGLRFINDMQHGLLKSADRNDKILSAKYIKLKAENAELEQQKKESTLEVEKYRKLVLEFMIELNMSYD